MTRLLGLLLGGLSGVLQDRMALLGTEMREEAVLARSMLIGSVAAIILGALGLAFAGLAFVVAVGEQYRAWAAAGVALVFGLATAYAVWKTSKVRGDKPGPFSASLEELKKDREALGQRAQAGRDEVAQGGRELARLVSIGLVAYTIARRLRSSKA
jgi:uncharacterized membrane protein YqjE